MAQVVRFDPKSDDSTHRIIKSKYGIGLQSSKNLTEQSRPGTAAVRNTKVRAGIDALDYEYNHDERTQSPRLTAARLQLAVGRRGLGPREQEQRIQHSYFVAIRIMRGYTQGSSSRAGLGCFVQKKSHVRRLDTSLRGQTRD